ncbi:Caspase domain-containing protein [Pleurostoma richardsiae]|uniref:Caspase domain-containing protein n=1 Tax=Pleurostoma richardsiae TaxID=41990 RepID=A0AA38RIV7_9PEZI|nr:Caspase domain-containing protein [Pleurostoma richardsiae]
MSGYPGSGYHGSQGGYGPPPPQGGYGPPPPQGGYGPPPGGYGPPPGGYGPPQGGYGHPPHHQPPPSWGPPQQQQGGYYNQYPPPQGPPPPQLDSYGYPNQQQQQYHHSPTPSYGGQQHGGSGYGGGYGGGGYGGDSRGAARPPSAPQQFGHGAPSGYTFQYSNCTGRRKALLIGINYFGQTGELKGCINDVRNVSSFLTERYGYKREDMVILTDDQSNSVMVPTRQNILRAMNWLVSGAQPNDSLFLHYSGHGGQTADLDGDEQDGTDEVIYPVDYKSTGHIVDDELHHVVVKPLQAGVRLTAIFDSCHSGSVLDLPYIYSTKGVLKEPNLAKEAGMGLLGAISAYASGNIGGVASSLLGVAKSAFRGDEAYQKTIETKTSPADVIMWSGSKDDQTSADATIAAQATGAMSYAFISAIRQNPNQTYLQLLNSIRDILESKYSQKPQLSCSHPLDTNLLFVM